MATRGGVKRSSKGKRDARLIKRTLVDGGFTYSVRGRAIRSATEIERIEALAIPPAWTDVRISRSPRAKVLARGVDAAGREQAIYNPSFRRRMEHEKYERMVGFGCALPKLRKRVDRDLRRRGLPRDRVIACIIRLIDLRYFRVGNSRYAMEYHSYGITTLRESHVSASSSGVDFDFIGKSGKRQQLKVRDARIARVVSQLLEMPGPEVFRFFDDDGVIRNVRSRHVNAYVKRHAGGDSFSAKDFRTWGGSLLACAGLFAMEEADWETSASRSAALRGIVKDVAEKLGNTPEVTRSSYIDPRLLAMTERRDDFERIRSRRSKMRDRKFFSVEEQCLLEILRLPDR